MTPQLYNRSGALLSSLREWRYVLDESIQGTLTLQDRTVLQNVRAELEMTLAQLAHYAVLPPREEKQS